MSNYSRIFFLGHPNTGKTHLINTITGSKLKTGNYSGVTVDKKEISCKCGGGLATYVDLPGIKKVNKPVTEDEKITNNVMNNEITDNDLIFFFIDICYLENGISDLEYVIENVKNKNILCIIDTSSSVCNVDDDLRGNLEDEYKIKFILKQKDDQNIRDILNKYVCNNSFEREKNDIKKNSNIIEKIKKILPDVSSKKDEITDILDNIFLNKIFGLPIFICFFYFFIKTIFFIGDKFEVFTSFFYEILLNKNENSGFFSDFLINGIGSAILTIINIIPTLFMMFSFLFLIERSGYISRISYLLNGILKVFNIDGRSIIPLINGLGCSITAYASTRIIEDKKDKIATMIAIGLIPCSAKIALFIFLTKIIFQENAYIAMLCIYFFSFLAAFLILKIFGNKDKKYSNMIIELPIYRGFRIKEMFIDSSCKIKSFVSGAGKTILISYSLIWILMKIPMKSEQNLTYSRTFVESFSKNNNSSEVLKNSVLGKSINSLDFLFRSIGFDSKIALSIGSSIIAKEVAIGTISALYEDRNKDLNDSISLSIDKKTSILYIIFLSILFPCVSAMSAFKIESKSKKLTIKLIIWTVVFGYFICFLMNRII